jgi:hypothetical protein
MEFVGCGAADKWNPGRREQEQSKSPVGATELSLVSQLTLAPEGNLLIVSSHLRDKSYGNDATSPTFLPSAHDS